MKPLYYLAFAKSIDSNNQPIPSSKLVWITPSSKKIAYDDVEICNRERLSLQEELDNYIVRVVRASFFKNIAIHISQSNGGDWVIVETI